MGKVRQDQEDYRGQLSRVSVIMNDALQFIHNKDMYDEFLKYLEVRDEERNES